MNTTFNFHTPTSPFYNTNSSTGKNKTGTFHQMKASSLNKTEKKVFGENQFMRQVINF
jgi:hypothetical protein